MKRSLFQPQRLKLPPALLLVPSFVDRELLATVGKSARSKRPLLNATLLTFERHALLTGFIGYPNLLTLLEFVADLGRKEVYFLGLAGGIDPCFDAPRSVSVTSIRADASFRHLSKRDSFPLKRFPLRPALVRAAAVSVDLIQRETRGWLRRQGEKAAELVEMELYPLRVFLGRPFHALVVVSDRVTVQGIVPFADREQVRREFHRSFNLIMEQINHG